MFFIRLTCVFIFLMSSPAFAQDDKVVKSVTIDPVIISASKSVLDVQSFISIQKKDTTLLNAFRMLRKGNYYMDSRLVVFNRKDMEKATVNRRSRHECDSIKQGIRILEEKIDGTLLDRKGRHKYYTALLFDKAFFPEQSKNEMKQASNKKEDPKASGDYARLKDIVFSPGAAVDLPFIGKRLAIFDDEMVSHYDYTMKRELLADSIWCYVFRCNAKVDSKGRVDDKPVVKSLETWFRQGSYEVLKRKTNYVYHGLLADLDIDIDIDLIPYQNKAIPALITYSGYWNVPGKRAEIVWFRLAVRDYQDCKN